MSHNDVMDLYLNGVKIQNQGIGIHVVGHDLARGFIAISVAKVMFCN